MVGFDILLLIVLFFVSPAIILNQASYAQNYTIPQKLPANYKIFAQVNTLAAPLEFYCKKPVYLATGFLKTGSLWGEKQYEIWGIPNLKKGESIIYYGDKNPKFLQYFNKVTPLPKIQLYLIEEYLNNMRAYKLEGYLGENAHP